MELKEYLTKNKKRESKSFTIEEILIGFFIFLISLATILNSYLAIIRTHLIIKNNLIALQNLKHSLDRIYTEIKSSEISTTTNNRVVFFNTQDCATRTLLFVTSSQNIGYLALIKDNTTITLTDTNSVNIIQANFYSTGTIITTSPSKAYYVSSIKSLTIAVEAKNLLTRGIEKQLNLQLNVQPFTSFFYNPSCFNYQQ